MKVKMMSGDALIDCDDVALPVIDMSTDDDDAKLAQRVGEACREHGFFYLVGHGVPQSLIDVVFKQSKSFFTLPLDVKMQVMADSNNRGYTCMHSETLDPLKQSIGDTKEGYYIGRDIEADDNDAILPLHGPNQWPDAKILPNWREVMSKYFNALEALGHRIARLFALALGLDVDFFAQAGVCDKPMLFLRLLHYSAVESKPDDGIFGAGAHTDYGLLTLLITDDVSGLQVYRKDVDSWVDVKPLYTIADDTQERLSSYIVNVGDMLQRWSNDIFTSTLHRVIMPGCERYSIPFFWEPNFNCHVDCLPQCCSADRPARYKPTTSGQHLLDKYKQTQAEFSQLNHI